MLDFSVSVLIRIIRDCDLAEIMCVIQRWTLVDSDGVRHPQERLAPCASTKAGSRCLSIMVRTMNDEVLPPRPTTSRSGKPDDSDQSMSVEEKQPKNDLRRKFEFPFLNAKKKKEVPAPVNRADMLPGLVSLDQPLISKDRSTPTPSLPLPVGPSEPPPRPPSQSRRPAVLIEPEPTREYLRSRRLSEDSHDHFAITRPFSGDRPKNAHGTNDLRQRRRHENADIRSTSTEQQRRLAAEERAARMKVDPVVINTRRERIRSKQDELRVTDTPAREREMKRLGEEFMNIEIDQTRRNRRAERVIYGDEGIGSFGGKYYPIKEDNRSSSPNDRGQSTAWQEKLQGECNCPIPRNNLLI